MDSINTFTDSLAEVDTLLEYAKKHTRTPEKYQLFNKIAIILLVTKFEVFIENFFEEHLNRQLNSHTKDTFPEKMRYTYLESAISKMNEFGQKTHKKDPLAKELSKLYQSSGGNLSSIRMIAPSTNFPNGKHRQKDMNRLFESHGLEGFILRADIVSLFSQINSCFGIRNSVIHQDAAPALTHQEVQKHKNTMLDFAYLLAADIEMNKSAYYNEY